jgi:phosphoglycolate phosphatase
MSASRHPVAVFDLDGTLADTIYDLIATLNVVLASEGLPALSLDEGRSLVGAGARALIERGLSVAGRSVTSERLDQLHQSFLEHYGRNLCVESRLFPGVVAALDRLEEAGFVLAVCTNKYERHSIDLLEGLGIAARFRAICGRDSFPHAKPDPRHLLLTVERAGGDPARAVMVGDSVTDIVTAKAARIPVVAVTFGYTDRPVQELDPDILIDHYDQLFDAVEAVIPTLAPAVATA